MALILPRPEPVLYIDMDGVQADFHGAHYTEGQCKYEPGFFLNLRPLPGAIPTIKQLLKVFTDAYILSAPMDDNPRSAYEKLLWIKQYFGDGFKHKVILANHKFRVGTSNDFLVDDWEGHGNINFPGEFVHFGSEKYPNWTKVFEHLKAQHEAWQTECDQLANTEKA